MKARVLSVLAAVAVLTGCVSAPQLPVPLAKETFATKTSKVGVAMTALPKVDTSFPGAACLLCYGLAAAANSTLTTHTQTLSYDDLPQFKMQIADALRKQGLEVKVINEDLKLDTLPKFKSEGPNIARLDFSSLQQKYGIDKLVVFDIQALGFVRTYAQYFPTSDPKAVLEGTGYVVNLSNNTYEWYLPVSIQKGTDGKWDEPPTFPGLTNAYFQTLELGKDSFSKPLK